VSFRAPPSLAFARVEVHEERPIGREAAERSLDARKKEAFEVVEPVGVRPARDHGGLVPLAPEPSAVLFPLGAAHLEALALLISAGIERRVDVDEARE
jgi:hypothetical protein